VTVATETDEPGADATARSARLRHLIITVYGLYARHDGGWLSVATLIRLLADLGIDEPAVRSAISRLKRRGILQSRRHDGAAGYQLSAEALAILREGDARIFRRGRATPADGWVLAVFSVPESERHRRHVLRSELTRLGFGMVAPGVWIVPAHPQDTTAETLRRLELDAYADLFRADHLAFGDPAAKVRQWWDLDELERHYESFIRAHEPAPAGPRLGTLRRAGSVRRVRPGAHRLAAAPLPDPGCPPNCCPKGGSASGADLLRLRALLEEPARAYVKSVSR
jgi:phenylacetic acid degradation operon negative regulatory protein